MNQYIFIKGRSLLEVQEIGTQGRIVGLNGFIDFIDLLYMLQANGYKLSN